MALPTHLARAYRNSRYSVAGLPLTIGRRSGALDGLLTGMGVRDAVLITAWNPASRRMPRPWNDRMMAALRHRLGSTPSLPATGAAGTGAAGSGAAGIGAAGAWAEDHLLVTGDRRRLAVLARVFRQAALVGLRRGQELRLLPLI